MKVTQSKYDEILKGMVDAFLGWKLPKSFYPDSGISFDRTYVEKYPTCWPSGTNLFNDTEAKEMFEVCLKSAGVFDIANPIQEESLMSSNCDIRPMASVTDVPAMSANRVFALRGLDKNRPFRLISTQQEVVYCGYTPTSQPIVHPVDHEDPSYLMVISINDLENVPEPGVAYIKVSEQPFDGGTKVRTPFDLTESVLKDLIKSK